MLLEEGRVVYITAGRHAGMRGVVVGMEDGRVKVRIGQKVKSFSIRHVEPVAEKENA